MKKPKTWACTRCDRAFSVKKSDPDIALIPDVFKCWGVTMSGKTCRGKLEAGPASASLQMRGLDLYKAIMGMGLNEERDASMATLNKLVGKKVVAFGLKAAPVPERSMIDSLTLEGGVVLHLATSTKGVTVYKVTKAART